MSWRTLLQSKPETVVVPWLGGRELRVGARRWSIAGTLPPEHGWHAFRTSGRSVVFEGPTTKAGSMVPSDVLRWITRGVPIGDRFVPEVMDEGLLHLGHLANLLDQSASEKALLEHTESVHLLDPGLQRFEAVLAGRAFEGGPLVYAGRAMPDEAAFEVLEAWERGARSLADLRGVTPALEIAFQLLWRQREAAERARAEIERLERLRELDRAGGTAMGRRQLAAVDFTRAALAALAAGGAELVDEEPGARPTERVVRFRVNGLRFECVCHATTLQVIDSGVCLTDHATGRRDDALLSLESLPSVIREAISRHRLHVYRPVEPRRAYEETNRGDDWEENTPW